MAGISPKLPLRRDGTDGFSLNKTQREALQQNLKNLVLTSPGERIMDPNFGVGIRNYLFENQTQETYSQIEERIQVQVSIYMPYITLGPIDFLEGASDSIGMGRQFSSKTINNNISFDPDASPSRLNVAIPYSAGSGNDLLVLSVDLS